MLEQTIEYELSSFRMITPGTFLIHLIDQIERSLRWAPIKVKSLAYAISSVAGSSQ